MHSMTIQTWSMMEKRKEKKRKPHNSGKVLQKLCNIEHSKLNSHVLDKHCGNIGCVTGPKSHVFGWGEEAYRWIANQFSQSESVCTHVQTPPDPNIICAYTCYCRQYKSSATSFCTQIVVLLLQDVSIWWCPRHILVLPKDTWSPVMQEEESLLGLTQQVSITTSPEPA
jgi:hypothetical protein